MNRLRTSILRCLDDLVDAEIGLGRSRRADMHGLVRHIHMYGVIVRIGVDRHRPDPHGARGLHHTASNLAAIGDEDFVEH